MNQIDTGPNGTKVPYNEEPERTKKLPESDLCGVAKYGEFLETTDRTGMMLTTQETQPSTTTSNLMEEESSQDQEEELFKPQDALEEKPNVEEKNEKYGVDATPAVEHSKASRSETDPIEDTTAVNTEENKKQIGRKGGEQKENERGERGDNDEKWEGDDVDAHTENSEKGFVKSEAAAYSETSADRVVSKPEEGEESPETSATKNESLQTGERETEDQPIDGDGKGAKMDDETYEEAQTEPLNPKIDDDATYIIRKVEQQLQLALMEYQAYKERHEAGVDDGAKKMIQFIGKAQRACGR